MNRVVAVLIALVVLVYLGDYVSVRFRIPHQRDRSGTVRILRYYAVPKKNGKPDFYFDPPYNEPCVHSLFPHFNELPCWYLKRHAEQRVNE